MISRRILAAVVLFCAFVAPAHAQKTKAAIITEIPQLCPLNQTAGLCTVANANQLWSDIVNSIMPTSPVVSGNLACYNGTTGLLQDCGIPPASAGLTVGSSVITGGANTRVLYDNNGILGEYATIPSSLMPSPGASSLGGVQSKTCSTSNWFNTLSTGGVFGCSQPAFSDLTGSITSAQCVAATVSAQGCVIPDGVTITIVGGKIVASGGTATAVDVGGATSVTNCGTSNAFLENTSSSKVGCTAGPWTLLATLTGTTISDTTHLTSTYNDYEIQLENVIPATNNVTLELQVHSGGSFQSTGYIGSSSCIGSGAAAIANPTTFVQVSEATAVQNTTAGGGLSGRVQLNNPSNTTMDKAVTGQTAHSNGTVFSVCNFAGSWAGGTGAVDGFQIIASTGALTSATVKIYGRL